MIRKIRVLIVDDSAIVRKLLVEALSEEPGIEVVGTAPDPYIARDKILSLSPDVLTLDIEMPRMDGLTFLKKLMIFRPMPVIVISSLDQASYKDAVEALCSGAVDILAKPGGRFSVTELRSQLVNKIHAAATAHISLPRPSGQAHPAKLAMRVSPRAIIAIGASIGGAEAIECVLTRLPPASPGIVITQHIPAGFSRTFAERLNKLCPMRVAEAADGDLVRPGLALIAPGNYHMMLSRTADGYQVKVRDGPTVCYQRPSVDVLFTSVAETAGPHAVGVILTGMGSDGAQGLSKMRSAGAATIAQDEATCVVFGMPREAISLGAAGRVIPLPLISAAICRELSKSS